MTEMSTKARKKSRAAGKSRPAERNSSLAPRTAAVSANRTSSSLALAQELISTFDSDREMLRDIESGDVLVPRDQAATIQRSVPGWRHSATVIGMWESLGKQALSMDERVLARISTASSSKLYPEIFRALPYIDPLVVFPQPMFVRPYRAGERMELIGFIITSLTGRTGNGAAALAHSNDPAATALRINYVFRVTDETTGTVTREFDYVSLPLDAAPYTLKECVGGVVSRFMFGGCVPIGANGGLAADSKRNFISDIVSIAVSTLLYLCSTTLEAEKVPRKAIAKVAPPHPHMPLSLLRIGWKTGEALSCIRTVRDRSDNPSQQGGPTHEQDPQHRRAHIRTVWTGPGSSIPKACYIEPYWTHREKLDGYLVNTVRKVG